MTDGAPGGSDDRVRCRWAASPPMTSYHDDEWGVPHHDDRALFELLILEGAQAGLSWRTVLERRHGYRNAFCQFDPELVAQFDDDDQARLLADAGIVRNRAKVKAAVTNAREFLAVQAESGSFDAYLWAWVDGSPIIGGWGIDDQLPASTPLAEQMSKDLRRRGFGFVGPTILYSFLQATGVVMDHATTCFRYADLS